MDRIQQLEELIQKHNIYYWVDNNPQITDEEFDKLEAELRELNPNSKILNQVHTITPIESTRRKKVVHDTPMLSLDKVYTIPKLISWCEKFSRNENELFEIQPKLDGCSADFSNGILSTRGDDGILGIDISDKIPLINIESKNYIGPLSGFNGNIRGEIIIKKQTFKKYKNQLIRKDGSFYKIERNATVGLLLQDNLTSKSNMNNILTLVSYEYMSIVQNLNVLKKMSWEYLIEEVKECDYPTDGLVIKLYDANYSISLGNTEHHPKGQIALKYGNPKVESTLINVIWQCGKSKLTPVGIIKPVVLAGAEINKVTLHNAKFILEKDIKINDLVLIERSGEIIPHIISRTAMENRTDIVLDCCPICKHPIQYNEPELLCTNINCVGKNIRNILDAVKRLGLENIGEPTIEKLVADGFESLYQILNIKLEEISKLEGFADISSSNLYNEIQRLKQSEIEDWKFLSSLNIPGIGSGLCKKLLSNLTLFELGGLSIEQLCTLPDIGMERAIAIRDAFDTRVNEIINLLSILKIKNTQLKYQNSKTICFTGKSAISRDILIKTAENNNFKVVNNVTQNLDFLVTNDFGSTSSKTTNAKKYGVKIISYDDFNKMVI